MKKTDQKNKQTMENLQLKQVGGSPVLALLFIAGIGMVTASVMIASSQMNQGSVQVISTGQPGQPGSSSTVIVNNPGGPGYGGPGFGTGILTGAILGEAISDGHHQNASQYGGWVKNKKDYYYYELHKAIGGEQVVLISKYNKE